MKLKRHVIYTFEGRTLLPGITILLCLLCFSFGEDTIEHYEVDVYADRFYPQWGVGGLGLVASALSLRGCVRMKIKHAYFFFLTGF